MLKGVKNILFDLGGVLFHIDYQRTIDAFKNLGINDFEKYFTQHQQNDLFDAFETGKINQKVFVTTLQDSLPACSDQEIIDAWNAMLISLPQEYLKFLDRLSKKYRLFLLSNANNIHIQFVNTFLKENYNIPSINQFFERVYYSHEIGMRKPYKCTFKWVLKDANILAEETLFIEDTAQHIEGAKQAGLKTYHLESNTPIISLFPGTTL
tara:strand:+ start:107 stop:733 length:627 start_codon:yes stop_codon:yes gene_type:complete